MNYTNTSQHTKFFSNHSGAAVLGLGATGGIMLLGAFIVGAGMLGLVMIFGAVASLALQAFFGINYVATQHEQMIQLVNTQPAVQIEEQLTNPEILIRDKRDAKRTLVQL